MYTTNEQKTLARAFRIMEREAQQSAETIRDPATAMRFCALTLREAIASKREEFHALLLTNKHHLIKAVRIGTGTLTEAAVYPREVVKAAVEYGAAAVIFTHNHPSGDPAPSDADDRITKHLRDALALIDVRVLDHVIIGGGMRTYSYAEHGKIGARA